MMAFLDCSSGHSVKGLSQLVTEVLEGFDVQSTFVIVLPTLVLHFLSASCHDCV